MKNIGVFGSGQLGQMMAEEARLLGLQVHVYSPDQNSPASKAGAPEFVGDYSDFEKIKTFAHSMDVITFEFENIPRRTLEFLNDVCPKKIFPKTNALMIAQDRFLEKEKFKSLGLLTANYFHLTKETATKTVPFPFPWIIKTLRFGYDGKGQTKVNSDSEYKNFLDRSFVDEKSEFLIEEVVNFQIEISVIVTRFQSSEMITYGAIENIHKNHILDLSIFPARIDSSVSNAAIQIAKTLANDLGYVGTMGVEFFIKDSLVYLNEFAPRPHNSGHFTQDSESYSQFLLHILAVTGKKAPLHYSPKPTIMKNILGTTYVDSYNKALDLVNKDSRYKLHLYSKADAKLGRKMGHINFKGRIEDCETSFFEI